MTLSCVPVDADSGVVLRLAANAECAARTIGADGFQAMIGGPIAASLLSALITIFVAIVGYRLVLGTTPRLDEGVSRILRLGIVIALVTGWPAFQTLVYDTATQGPEEVAGTILPAAGLTPLDLSARVQQVYDAMRLGANGDPRSTEPQQGAPSSQANAPQMGASALGPQTNAGQAGLGALPQTASIFAVVTIGTLSALHLAVGILLAVAPLAILGLLFDGTLGLFNGWARALLGVVLAGIAATIVIAVVLPPIEQEMLKLQGWRGGGVLAVIDTQALPTLVLASAIAMLVAVLAAVRMGGMIRYAPLAFGGFSSSARYANHSDISLSTNTAAAPALARGPAMPGRDRAVGVAEALAATVRREQRMDVVRSISGVGADASSMSSGQRNLGTQTANVPGVATRRTSLRRSRASTMRDRVGR